MEMSRKREREEAEQDGPAAEQLCTLATVAEEQPSDEMDAALALSGMLGRAASPPPAKPEVGDLSDGQMAQIMSIVKKTTDYQLSDSQLRAILALKDGEAATPAAPAAPAPSKGPSSVQLQLQQQAALTATLASAAVLGAAVAAAPAPTAPAPAPPPKRRAVTNSRSLSWEDARVTLWDTVAKRRVSGSSYKGDLNSFLARNPHMEVYNRQDETKQPGQQLLAGQKMVKIETGVRSDPKVVVWHVRELRKLPVEECPTQSELFKFLRTNPDIVVYDGQDKAAHGVRKQPKASSASTQSCQQPLKFKRLTPLEPSMMGKPLANSSSPGPAGSALSYTKLAQLAQSAPAAAAAAASSPLPQLAQLQALLQQQAPAADSLTLLQAAQVARMANVDTAQLGQQLAIASLLAGSASGAGVPIGKSLV